MYLGPLSVQVLRRFLCLLRALHNSKNPFLCFLCLQYTLISFWKFILVFVIIIGSLLFVFYFKIPSSFSLWFFAYPNLTLLWILKKSITNIITSIMIPNVISDFVQPNASHFRQPYYDPVNPFILFFFYFKILSSFSIWFFAYPKLPRNL